MFRVCVWCVCVCVSLSLSVCVCVCVYTRSRVEERERERESARSTEVSEVRIAPLALRWLDSWWWWWWWWWWWRWRWWWRLRDEEDVQGIGAACVGWWSGSLCLIGYVMNDECVQRSELIDSNTLLHHGSGSSHTLQTYLDIRWVYSCLCTSLICQTLSCLCKSS